MGFSAFIAIILALLGMGIAIGLYYFFLWLGMGNSTAAIASMTFVVLFVIIFSSMMLEDNMN